jgi:hypothetical protein
LHLKFLIKIICCTNMIKIEGSYSLLIFGKINNIKIYSFEMFENIPNCKIIRLFQIRKAYIIKQLLIFWNFAVSIWKHIRN